MNKYQHWMVYSSNVEGDILVDDGCKEALINRKSLLAKGIIGVNKSFKENSVVNICDKDGVKFARGSVTYDSNTIRITMGKSSKEIKEIASKPIIHANNIVIGE